MYSQIDPALFFARDVATRHQTQSKAPVATAPTVRFSLELAKHDFTPKFCWSVFKVDS